MTADFSPYQGRTVCVTGGAGFIGAHLAHALVHHGASVSVIDDLSNGREANLAPIKDRVRFVRGSVLDHRALESAMSGAGIVFHLAAIASVPRSVREPALYTRVNATGTLRVLQAARDAGAQRLVYAASSSAYGSRGELPRVESAAPDPQSPYAAAKCAGEYMLRAFARCYGLPCISLRYFNIFGPRQRHDSPYAAVIPRFVKTLLQGGDPTIYGDGSQTRDFTYVANAVHANLLAGLTTAGLRGQVVNIASGRSATVLELLTAIAGLLGLQPRYRLAPPRTGEVRHSLASVDAARDLLGYEPLTDFHTGLEHTVASFTDL